MGAHVEGSSYLFHGCWNSPQLHHFRLYLYYNLQVEGISHHGMESVCLAASCKQTKYHYLIDMLLVFNGNSVHAAINFD